MKSKFIKALRKRLLAVATKENREWFESYTKHQERYLGVKTPVVEQLVVELAKKHSAPEIAAAWESLLESPYTEEKLAAMIIYQRYLTRDLKRNWRADLVAIKRLTLNQHIKWWNTCDWMCVRVLGRIILTHGMPAAKQIAAWRSSKNLWLKRMSLVSFVNHARKGDMLFRGNRALILGTAKKVVESPERFHQTAVGWVIREVYKGEAQVAERFIRDNISYFSSEGLRYATEKMPRSLVREIRGFYEDNRSRRK